MSSLAEKWLANNNNKDQSKLANDGVALASPPNSSFVFARWHHRTYGLAEICNCMLWLGGSTPQISPFIGGSCVIVVSLNRTNVPAKWHLNPSNGLSRVHECDDDRQTTDHAIEATAIPPNNEQNPLYVTQSEENCNITFQYESESRRMRWVQETPEQLQLNGCGKVLYEYALIIQPQQQQQLSAMPASAAAVKSNVRRFRVNVLISTTAAMLLGSSRSASRVHAEYSPCLEATAAISCSIQNSGVFRQPVMAPSALKICTILLPETSKYQLTKRLQLLRDFIPQISDPKWD